MYFTKHIVCALKLARLFITVVSTAVSDIKAIILNVIYKAVFVINPSAEFTLKITR